MHFHGDGAGRFQEHNARVGLNKSGNACPNQRIEPAGGNAELAEDFGAEVLAWLVGGIGHQDVVALLHKRQNGISDRRRTAREQRAACAALQFAHGFLQRKMG